MAKKPVLVVMAAGMGSRYGGLKQIDPVGCCGEAILDYSLYDAHAAGFETAVIIIKQAIQADFMATVGQRLRACPMEIRYAYQELDTALPQGFQIPEGRIKPWGTSHAVLSAAQAIDGAPFAVINSDDYYGRAGFRAIYDALSQTREEAIPTYFMVGYHLGNTVTAHGSVSRGVCRVDEAGMLVEITERKRIEQHPQGIRFTLDGENWEALAFETPVSMNLWGFAPSFLDALAERFPQFLGKKVPADPMKAEFLLPMTVAQLLEEDRARVQVLRSGDKWYGVTYAADKPQVVAALKEMTQAGHYPEGLWK